MASIIERVSARTRSDPFANLKRIGIDEIFDKRGQRYITIVDDPRADPSHDLRTQPPGIIEFGMP